MPVIVGLGNPGRKYVGTRHNIGYEVIDLLAEKLSVKLGPGKGPFYIGDVRYHGEKLLLVKPTTYMNRSGDAVQQVLNWYKLDAADCLVCYDDLNLPVGKIRMRPKGSAGGHNGIKDIIKKLGTDGFPRLRIGIGNDFMDGNQVDFVLSKFSKSEQKEIDQTLHHACEAAFAFVDHGIDTAMNDYN
ncbi:aminoacyl-tRNA hydrolase [Aliifodinibius sp. S!AR15-10]|uniref:aminoacyl-tRNA hydrolase n=1 Tax=Aliifodinibius sp. S!AR15-10 TaxID=2950437 RepID=UPI00286486D0|nr:aminoacyl-tRNA hydrolase [Aliifodinibius sp. S!AR15-10]MDR8393115.1 aminoacyl-tRNA hydrolase [Aliifodinibius sp. S!AR15-10]